MVRLDFTWSGLVFSEPLKIWSGLVFSDSQALLPLSKVVCWAWMGNIWLSVNVWAQLRTETKTKTKLSPTCQLLILKKKWRKKMKRDLHMMQLHKQLQAAFNFLGKSVCFFEESSYSVLRQECVLLAFQHPPAIFESKTPSQIFIFESRIFVGGLRHDNFCECKQYSLTENVSRGGRGSGEVLVRNLWIVDIPAGSASPLIFPPSTSVLDNYKLSSSLSSSSSKFKLSVNSL